MEAILVFVNALKINQFRASYSKIKPYSLCSGKISKDFRTDNMKNQD